MNKITKVILGAALVLVFIGAFSGAAAAATQSDQLHFSVNTASVVPILFQDAIAGTSLSLNEEPKTIKESRVIKALRKELNRAKDLVNITDKVTIKDLKDPRQYITDKVTIKDNFITKPKSQSPLRVLSARGPDVAGVIGSAVAAGVLLASLK